MPSESPEPRVRVHVLGRFLVEVDGEALALSPRGKRKPLELLKVLIALEGAQASVAEITETLWPDAEGDKGYRTFSITLNRLRGLVGHDAVRLQGGRLSLNADLCWVDAFHFSKLVADAATEAGVDRLADLAGGAVALYRGPFLPGEFDLPEVLSARDRLHGQFLRLVETCGDRLAAVDADRGMILYRRGIETDPLAESFYLRLMEQLHRQGRATEAIALYQRAERLFESSLGSRPSPQLIALAEHIQQAQRGGGVYEPSAAPTTLPASTASTVPPGGGRRPASATGERLRATAVFCDIAGYTSLSEREDPEVVEDILSAFRATATHIMERHGGIVNQFVGDEVVALFGVVQAHEDDAARAVRAALDLHMAVEREGRQHGIRFPLQLHTGINTGLMLVKPQGGPDGTYRVNGDALNTAARLRSMAPAGEIWVGPEVATAVQAYVTLEACDPVQPRGRLARLTPSRVKGLRRRQDRFEPAKARGVSPLYGRDAELATLRSCLTQAREGQGQIVAVVGEAGIGKSRLLHEFVLGLDRSQWIVLRAHCLANDQGTPYRPLKELLRRGLFLQRISAERLAVADVTRRLNAVAPALSRFLPYYLHLLDVHSAEHPIPVGVSGPALSAHLVESLAALVTHGLALRPIVVLIEDWHWADSASDAGLMTLLGMAAQYPLLIVVTHRPDYTGRWIDAQPTRIDLRPLSPVDSAALAQSAAGANRLPASMTGRIHAHTEGNPLFIEELTRAYVETQVSRTSSAESDDVWAGIVSGTVQGVIRSRLSRLDEECVELLRLASVIGAQFSRRLLEQIAPPGLPMAAALERLQTSGAIRQVRVVPEPLFRFAHSIARLVVYETLLLQRRLTLHEQVGFAIERAAGERLPDHVEALAHHYARSANALQAVRYLEAAGDKAARVFALREARRDYREALLRLRKDAPSEASASCGVDLALKWVQVSFYQPSQELVQAVEQARADAQALGDGGRLARTTFWAGALHCARGSLVQAREHLERCLAMPEVRENAEVHAMTVNYLGRVAVYQAEFAAAIPVLEGGIALMRALPREWEAANSEAILVVAHSFLGNFRAAQQCAAAALASAERGGSPAARAVAYVCQAVAFNNQGHWEHVAAPADAGRDLAQRIGNDAIGGIATWCKGCATVMGGDPSLGIALMTEGISMIETTDSRLGLSGYLGRLALMYVDQGRFPEAAATARKALEIVNQGGDRAGEWTAKAALELAGGGADPAAPDLREAIRIADDRGARPYAAFLRIYHGEALNRRGDATGAKRALDEAIQMLTAMDMPWWREKAQALLMKVG